MMLRCVIVKTVELVELIDVCKTDSFGETILVPHSCHNYRHYYYHLFIPPPPKSPIFIIFIPAFRSQLLCKPR